jgi:hypothetical protein
VIRGDLDSHAVGWCNNKIDLRAELDGLSIVRNIVGGDGQVVNFYATVPAPATLAQLNEDLNDRYGTELPLVDLFYWGAETGCIGREQSEPVAFIAWRCSKAASAPSMIQ